MSTSRHGGNWASAAAALDRALRKRVLERHARLKPSGQPITCTPLGGGTPRRHRRETEGTDGKVIFDSKEAAEAAAAELQGLGAKPMRAYPCSRSRHGHYHLASKKMGGG